MSKPRVILNFIAIVIMLFGIFAGVVGPTNSDECENYHPHIEQIGGYEDALKMLDYIAQGTMKITVWKSDARYMIENSWRAQRFTTFIGTGNPTTFAPNLGQQYANNQGFNTKVTSPKEIQKVRDYVGNCLRPSLEAQYEAVKSGQAAPISIHAEATTFALTSSFFVVFAGVALLIGGNLSLSLVGSR